MDPTKNPVRFVMIKRNPPSLRTYVGKHGISLFNEVPLNRTCADASVPGHYCACEHSVDADPQDPKLRDVAEFLVSQLNSGLRKFPQCAQLEFETVRAQCV